MSLAHVNIADVNVFRKGIRQAKNDFFRTQDNFLNTVDAAAQQVEGDIGAAKELLVQCDADIQFLNGKLQIVKQNLSTLRSRLYATPPTLTETYEDSRGNIQRVETPNPEYQRLCAEVARTEAQVTAVEDQIRRFVELKSKVNYANETLQEALQMIRSSVEIVSEKYKHMNALSDSAITKLTKIEEILQAYLDEKLDEPKINIPTFFRGDS